jgi:hypothetical protein
MACETWGIRTLQKKISIGSDQALTAGGTSKIDPTRSMTPTTTWAASVWCRRPWCENDPDVRACRTRMTCNTCSWRWPGPTGHGARNESLRLERVGLERDHAHAAIERVLTPGARKRYREQSSQLRSECVRPLDGSAATARSGWVRVAARADPPSPSRLMSCRHPTSTRR